MASSLTPQGTLNRLRGSILIPAFPSLNITAAFLGKEGISASPKGPATTRIGTMTGAVTSPEPYREFTLTAHLIKAQAFSDAWKLQEELNTLLGDITVRPDSSMLSPYQYDNCSLDGVNGLTINGMDAGFVITISGVYYINSQMW